MTNDALRIKVRERFNKLSSQDYENLEDWQILEAFHKAQLTWVRQQLAGKNPGKEVDESSKQIRDDLNVLLTDASKLVFVEKEKGLYTEAVLPADYMGFKRVSALAKNACCPSRRLRIEPCEVANRDFFLEDTTHKPSFEWAETFFTLSSQKIQIYLDNQFQLVGPILTYYKEPPCPEIEGILNLQTGEESTKTIEPVFSYAVCELLLDKTVQILAGDTENTTQYQRASTDLASEL